MVVTCLAMVEACLLLVATSCYRKSFLLVTALSILSMYSSIFPRIWGVTPVSDLDGLDATFAALALPNYPAPPQAWIYLYSP